jgi:dihydroorotase-like cyclic amidohydrolase
VNHKLLLKHERLWKAKSTSTASISGYRTDAAGYSASVAVVGFQVRHTVRHHHGGHRGGANQRKKRTQSNLAVLNYLRGKHAKTINSVGQKAGPGQHEELPILVAFSGVFAKFVQTMRPNLEWGLMGGT